MTSKKSYSRYFIILQEDERGYGLAAGKAPTGYAKIEIKNSKCKVSYYVQNLKAQSHKYCMILICGKKGTNKLINIGNLNLDEHGRSDVSYEYDVTNIANSNISVDKIIGAAVAKKIDSNIISVMSGFTTTDIPNDWKRYVVIDSDNKREEKDNIFEQYEKSIEDTKKNKEKQIEESAEETNKENDHKIKEEIQSEKVRKEVKSIKVDKEEVGKENKEEIQSEKVRKEVKSIEVDKDEVDKENKEDVQVEELDNETVDEEKKVIISEKDYRNEEVEKVDEEKGSVNEKSNLGDEEKEIEKKKEEKYNKVSDEENNIDSPYRKSNDFMNEVYYKQNCNKDNRCCGCKKGPTGEFFEDLTEDFEEVTNVFSKIKNCKWYKVPIKSVEDMCDMSDYDKYVVIYYPMICYYPYIKKYNHYLVGYKYDKKGKIKYIVYAIPGRKSTKYQPYAGRTGFVTWMHNRKNCESEGYWLMFYDFKTSNILIPVKKKK
ncbi:hypothetical protein ACFIJ5_16770 [Haloimpatiens sp. FM7330]|uniref:hypothetical protein n=1 Tax=Haloimpatiens sp. FM7330 TaxID=3298610 RepID=UPI0036349258